MPTVDQIGDPLNIATWCRVNDKDFIGQGSDEFVSPPGGVGVGPPGTLLER